MFANIDDNIYGLSDEFKQYFRNNLIEFNRNNNINMMNGFMY